MENDDDILSDGAMSPEQAAEFTSFSLAKIYVLMSERQLTYVQHGRRRLIPKKALLKFLAEHLVASK